MRSHHCERSEAIQYYSGLAKLDCFVASLLAMTGRVPAMSLPHLLPTHRPAAIRTTPAAAAMIPCLK